MIAFIALSLAGAAADPNPPPPEVAAAEAAWNACLQEGLDRADPQASPRAVSRQIADDCTDAAQAMVAARTRWIEASPLSEREKRQAVRGAEARVTAMTRMMEMMVRASRDD